YQVVVTNLYGSTTSAPANLVVAVPAKILTSPTDQVATNSDTVTWNVLAQGTSPLAYQWFFNLTNALKDATNASLVLSNVGPAQAGFYDVVVVNPYGSVTSSPSMLVVFVPPTIVCSPDKTVALDSPWDFTPPTFNDPHLTLTTVGTSTNGLCGGSYSATRHWVVSATNGYQVACSQTVQVLDSSPPVISCVSNKSTTLGNNWSFDSPAVRDAGAVEGLVYDNLTNKLNQSLDPGQVEVGNQVSLAGAQ